MSCALNSHSLCAVAFGWIAVLVPILALTIWSGIKACMLGSGMGAPPAAPWSNQKDGLNDREETCS